MKASEKRNVINRLIAMKRGGVNFAKTFGTSPLLDKILDGLPEITAADQMYFAREKEIEEATKAITDYLIDGTPDKELALADIPTINGRTVADLPTSVATSLANPQAAIARAANDEDIITGLNQNFAVFVQAVADFFRIKQQRALLRKLPATHHRLALASGCLAWAALCGNNDISKFQDAFTSALILDRDATAELNGETIDAKPEETEMPIDKAVLMQILEGVKQNGEMLKAQGDKIAALSEKENPSKSGDSTKYRKYPQDAEALELLGASAKRLVRLRKDNPNATCKEAVKAVLDEPDGKETNADRQKRLNLIARVWHGAVKNGQRTDAKRQPPERLSQPERERALTTIYETWGKHLSAYIINPPAK